MHGQSQTLSSSRRTDNFKWKFGDLNKHIGGSNNKTNQVLRRTLVNNSQKRLQEQT